MYSIKKKNSDLGLVFISIQTDIKQQALGH